MESESNPLDEFSKAIPVEKFHRYCVAHTEEGLKVYFGLLSKTKTMSYFEFDSDQLSFASWEISELSRRARFAELGNPPEMFIHSWMPTPETDSSGNVKPFVGPNMKLMRAHLLLEQLVEEIWRYGERLTIIPVEVGPYDDNTIEWRATFRGPAPGLIPLIIGDIAHNLRSSLDILIGDLARLSNQSSKQLKMPFAKDMSHLEKILADDHCKKLNKKMVQKIRELRPVSVDGNLELRGLHDLDITDKHKIILPTYVVSHHELDVVKSIESYLELDQSTPTPSIGYLGPQVIIPIQEGTRLYARKGSEPMHKLSRLAGGTAAKFPTGFRPFGGSDVVKTLTQLLRMSAAIIADFEKTFRP
ncbi:hypothetical protein [Hoeflea sp.]|uniref:hypothetical protein n=1 Tax=Hoeflea sp. TaxID=1940281 RepID=UPI003BB11BAD